MRHYRLRKRGGQREGNPESDPAAAAEEEEEAGPSAAAGGPARAAGGPAPSADVIDVIDVDGQDDAGQQAGVQEGQGEAGEKLVAPLAAAAAGALVELPPAATPHRAPGASGAAAAAAAGRIADAAGPGGQVAAAQAPRPASPCNMVEMPDPAADPALLHLTTFELKCKVSGRLVGAAYVGQPAEYMSLKPVARISAVDTCTTWCCHLCSQVT